MKGRSLAKVILSFAFIAASAGSGYLRNLAARAAPAVSAVAPKHHLAPVVFAPPVIAPPPSATPPEKSRVVTAKSASSASPDPKVTPPVVGSVEAEATLPAIAPAAPGRKRFQFSDGDYTGEPADSEWGEVQVKVEIHDGYIADVHLLKIPDHRDRSAEISAWAGPRLIAEAIHDQYYDVDIVSSATFTTMAFQKTLWSALSQAQK